MPGYAPSGEPDPGDKGNYYCDANKVWGQYCWEMDTIEANMHTMQVTAHSCGTAPGKYTDACDTAGARRNSWFADPLGLCAEDNCVIDSRKPFRHVQSFITDNNDSLIRIENRLLQGTQVFAFNGTSDQAYLARMSEALREGMVLTFQLWGSSWLLMSWLDFMSGCFGSCPTSSKVIYSNISITQNGNETYE